MPTKPKKSKPKANRAKVFRVSKAEVDKANDVQRRFGCLQLARADAQSHMIPMDYQTVLLVAGAYSEFIDTGKVPPKLKAIPGGKVVELQPKQQEGQVADEFSPAREMTEALIEHLGSAPHRMLPVNNMPDFGPGDPNQ